MPYAEIDEGISLYYELTGPEDAPVVLQFGGGLFGGHNFGLVNDGFRERLRLLSFDARGYGASAHPREKYTIEGWAEDGAKLLDAVGLDQVDIVGLSDPYTVRQAASRWRRWISLRSCRRSPARC